MGKNGRPYYGPNFEFAYVRLLCPEGEAENFAIARPQTPSPSQAAFHVGPGWAPVGQSWAPNGPRVGLTGAHLGMLLGFLNSWIRPDILYLG